VDGKHHLSVCVAFRIRGTFPLLRDIFGGAFTSFIPTLFIPTLRWETSLCHAGRMQWWEELGRLDPQIVEIIRQRAVARSYSRRTVLFREGDHPDGAYFIEDGRVLIESTTVEGAPVGLNVAGPGEIVGAQSLLRDAAQRSASVTVLRDLRVLLLRPTEFERLRQEHPMIDRFFITVLDQRLRQMSDRLAEAVHSSADERVRLRLRELCEAYDGTIQMSQESLASLCGTTRPTVNRVLRGMEEDGVLKLYRSRVQILEVANI